MITVRAMVEVKGNPYYFVENVKTKVQGLLEIDKLVEHMAGVYPIRGKSVVAAKVPTMSPPEPPKGA